MNCIFYFSDMVIAVACLVIYCPLVDTSSSFSLIK